MGRKKRKKRGGRVFRHMNGELREVTEPLRTEGAVIVMDDSKPQIEKSKIEAKKVSGKVATNFKLVIPKEVHQKIMWWIHKSQHEVSGFGALEHDEKSNTFTVKDVILLKQTVSATSTEIDPLALNKAMFQMRDEPLGLKWHWHSHVNMPVFWSADDMELIRSLGQDSWILATVFNKSEEMRTAFLTQVQVFGKPHDIFVDEIKTHVQEYLPVELCDKLDAEYAACVETERPKFPSFDREDPYYSGYYQGSSPYGQPFEHRYQPPTVTKPPEPVQNALDERRWAPSQEQHIVYDETGFGAIGNDLFYNPLHDEQVEDEADLCEAIDNMEWLEIKFLRDIDPAFEEAINKTYFPWKAKQPPVELNGDRA